MAQWLGQYSWLNHETKVRDIEESLRNAMASLEASPQAQRATKLKAVHHLAERLLAARLKALGARISALTEPGVPSTVAVVGQLAKLRVRESELLAGGVEVILREFGVRE